METKRYLKINPVGFFSYAKGHNLSAFCVSYVLRLQGSTPNDILNAAAAVML